MEDLLVDDESVLGAIGIAAVAVAIAHSHRRRRFKERLDRAFSVPGNTAITVPVRRIGHSAWPWLRHAISITEASFTGESKLGPIHIATPTPGKSHTTVRRAWRLELVEGGSTLARLEGQIGNAL